MKPRRLFRDEVTRISLAQLRSRFPPRVWRELKTVRLEVNGCGADVALNHVKDRTVHGGVRRWMVCPSCGGLAGVLGCVPGRGWACPRRGCGGWRGRNRTTTFQE